MPTKTSSSFIKKTLAGVLVSGAVTAALSSQAVAEAPPAGNDAIRALAQQEIAANSHVVKAYFPDQTIARKAAISFHAQLLETDLAGGYMIMDLDQEDRNRLAAFGFRFEPATDWLTQRNQQLESIGTSPPSALSSDSVFETSDFETSVFSTSVSAQSIPNYSCYETVEESFNVAQQMVNDYPNLASWIDVGDSWEKNQGQGGYDIYVLVLTNKQTTGIDGGEKPKLFINSAIHAREYTTAALTLDFARQLTSGYGQDADMTWILDNHEVHLMLQTNPDGRKRAETGLSWRKNVNTNYCGPTSNNRGADLNRNFTHGWNGANGSSGNQCNATYRGPFAASEPETQAIESYVRSLFPDKRGPGKNDAAPADTSGIHLDVHSYSELVLWPWGDTSTPAPNGDALQTLGRRFAWFNNYTPQQSIGLYPTDGTSDGVSYGELGVAAYTFELGTAFFQSCSVYNNTIKPKNLPALLYAAKVVRTPYITPAGPDITNLSLSDGAAGGGVQAGTPVTISASATDVRFNQSNGTESTQNISEAEFYLNTAPWESGATAIAMQSDDGQFNEKTESVSGTLDTSGLSNGKHMVYVRSKDSSGTWGPVSASFLIIDDNPNPTPEYCSAQGNNSSDEWISQMSIGSYTNSSSAAGYTDFTEANGGSLIQLASGNHNLTLTPSFGGRSYNEGWRIWADFNNDGDFEDSGEQLFSASPSSSAVSGSLTIPASALGSKVRLRVAMRYNTTPSSCGSFNYGEVEDYTLEVVEGSGGNDQYVYTNTDNQNIPDNGSVTSTLSVSSNAPAATSATVTVTATHTYHGDLRVTLENGNSLVVKNNSSNDGSGGTKSYSATLTTSQFGDFKGIWTLTVDDVYNQDTGSLDSWQIQLNP
ncbi:M14 family zinc carboxypeptidase [Parendozoicomonas sp. Alg238-R29]|uniref:M14 family zinc carboxypeptidase n=1 Tax=Parendozoicomonas sp. Alg238-R29 TaxID=2993446 RepID=UPI00248D76AB|nr:M14 family zinc carboxypeptidase [Parendozoicomonas sp. Alg238-R29]